MKVIYTKSGMLTLTQISPSTMKQIKKSASYHLSGVPLYYCGDDVYPLNADGYVIEDLPEAAE